MTTPALRLPIPGGLQLSVKLQQGGQLAQCVMGAFSNLETGVDATHGSAWLSAFWTNFGQVMHSSVTCTGATLRDVSGPDGVSFELPPPSSPAGSLTGSPAIAAGAYLVKWTTPRGGRSGRGRTYLPGLNTIAVDTDGRTVVAGTRNLVTTVAGQYLAAFESGTLIPLAPHVLSFTKGTSAPITGGTCAPIIGVQRRRMRG